MLKHIYDCGIKKMVEKERQLDNGRKQRNNKIKSPLVLIVYLFFSCFLCFFLSCKNSDVWLGLKDAIIFLENLILRKTCLNFLVFRHCIFLIKLLYFATEFRLFFKKKAKAINDALGERRRDRRREEWILKKACKTF